LTEIVGSESPSPQSVGFRHAGPSLQPSQFAPSANRAASADHEGISYSAPNPGHAQQLSRNLALILLLPHFRLHGTQLTRRPRLRIAKRTMRMLFRAKQRNSDFDTQARPTLREGNDRRLECIPHSN
jgi:hypothetical protein